MGFGGLTTGGGKSTGTVLDRSLLDFPPLSGANVVQGLNPSAKIWCTQVEREAIKKDLQKRISFS